MGNELSTKWLARGTERSRPRGHRPSGQEHERAGLNVKRRLGANPRTGFVKVSLTQWLGAGNESYAAGIAWGLAESTSWCEETRSKPDWYPWGWKRRITQVREFK